MNVVGERTSGSEILTPNLEIWLQTLLGLRRSPEVYSVFDLPKSKPWCQSARIHNLRHRMSRRATRSHLALAAVFARLTRDAYRYPSVSGAHRAVVSRGCVPFCARRAVTGRRQPVVYGDFPLTQTDHPRKQGGPSGKQIFHGSCFSHRWIFA